VARSGERALAMGYAEAFPPCRAVLVTIGYCYKLFGRTVESAFSRTPSAYRNLLRPRANYPWDPAVPGALGVLGRMLPGATKES
jgi:hypothetical protein